MSDSVLKIRPASETRWDCAALGEVMLRFDPGFGRVRNARTFQVWEGGGEYNVARAMRKCWGRRSTVVTALPRNDLGWLVEDLIMQGGVDVRLPRAQARPLDPREGLVVTVDRTGRVYLDQTALSYEDFRATFPAFVRTKRPTGVYLRADGRVAYATVVQVLAVMRSAGVADVGLVAEPETIER